MNRLEINLETQLHNEQLQCRWANSTIKELQEELENPMQTCPAYRLYTTPSRKVFLVHQNLILTPLSLPPKNKIAVKESELHLKEEEIS